MTTLQYKLNIPAYAHQMLWWVGEDGFEQAIDQPKGSLNLPETVQELRLCWGHPQGSPVQTWNTFSEVLVWDSRISLHGHLDSVHVVIWDEAEWLIFDLTGRLLPPKWQMLPTLTNLQNSPYSSRISMELAEEQFWYPIVTPLDSPFTDLIHHALINGQAVECYAALAGQASALQKLIGFPLLLEAMTLHASHWS